MEAGPENSPVKRPEQAGLTEGRFWRSLVLRRLRNKTNAEDTEDSEGHRGKII
jgi:hypothetical protein